MYGLQFIQAVFEFRWVRFQRLIFNEYLVSGISKNLVKAMQTKMCFISDQRNTILTTTFAGCLVASSITNQHWVYFLDLATGKPPYYVLI